MVNRQNPDRMVRTGSPSVARSGQPQEGASGFGRHSKNGDTTYLTTGSRVEVCAHADGSADLPKSCDVYLKREPVLRAPG